MEPSNKTLKISALLSALARGIALFLGAFTLLNILGEWRNPGFGANNWWIDLGNVSQVFSQIFLLIAAFCLLSYGLGVQGPRIRRTSQFMFLVLLYVTARNAVNYYSLLAAKAVYSGPALPFSLLLVAAFVIILFASCKYPTPETNPDQAGFTKPAPKTGLVLDNSSQSNKWLIAFSALACLLVFPVAQIYSFGATDYRRPADAIVVFGAKAYSNDTPSHALADRVRTACELYHAGLAPRLIFSGGPGQDDTQEAECMRRYAIKLGVPEAAIMLDNAGLSTYETVRNTTPLFEKMQMQRIMTVSHSFHLPRIKLCYQRARIDVFTVPVEKSSMSRSEFRFMLLRETAAMWAYYLRE